MRKALFAILVITGCGTQVEQPTETEPDGGAVVPTTEVPVQPEPEPEPTVEDALMSGSVLLQDYEGYEWEASFDLSLGTPTSDVTNARPGETDMFVPVEGGVTFTNRTDGREIPALQYHGDYLIAAIWPIDSAICGGNGYTFLTSGEYCAVELVKRAVPGPMPVDGSVSATWAIQPGDGMEWRIQEENFEAVSAELFEPTAWFFGAHGTFDTEALGDGSDEVNKLYLCVSSGHSGANDDFFWSSTPVECAA